MKQYALYSVVLLKIYAILEDKYLSPFICSLKIRLKTNKDLVDAE
jgi:hypothetical protein